MALAHGEKIDRKINKEVIKTHIDKGK